MPRITVGLLMQSLYRINYFCDKKNVKEKFFPRLNKALNFLTDHIFGLLLLLFYYYFYWLYFIINTLSKFFYQFF